MDQSTAEVLLAYIESHGHWPPRELGRKARILYEDLTQRNPMAISETEATLLNVLAQDLQIATEHLLALAARAEHIAPDKVDAVPLTKEKETEAASVDDLHQRILVLSSENVRLEQDYVQIRTERDAILKERDTARTALALQQQDAQLVAQLRDEVNLLRTRLLEKNAVIDGLQADLRAYRLKPRAADSGSNPAEQIRKVVGTRTIDDLTELGKSFWDLLSK